MINSPGLMNCKLINEKKYNIFTFAVQVSRDEKHQNDVLQQRLVLTTFEMVK